MAPSKARSRFQADLKSATESSIANISGIKKGDADDDFIFVFSHPSLPDPSRIEIHVQPQDMRGYPADNTFLVYTNDDVVPNVARVLEESIYETNGMKIGDMLGNISQRLQSIFESNGSTAEDDVEITNADADVSDLSMGDNDEASDDDIPFEYDEDELYFGTRQIINKVGPQSKEKPSPELLQRIRRDLLCVLQAGFHTGRISGLDDGESEGIISISIRASKLCLSKERREAWDLDSSEYIVLLVKYSGCYSTFEEVIETPAQFFNVSFRLRKCSKKKPSRQQATAAFSLEPGRFNGPTPGDPKLSHLWISKSIDEFMNNEFISMLKLRKQHGISWNSAKEILCSRIQASDNYEELILKESPEPESIGAKEAGGEAQLPPFLAADHMRSNGERSLPLIVTQFALHYLVRCTEYCTVCHRKVAGNFEAVRPYVCSEPLCLHQYMNLGLGASIDHEVVNHPRVVDLLISLCFTSLSQGSGMRDFPTGLNLQVPKIRKSLKPSFPIVRGSNDVTSSCAKEPRMVPIQGGILVDPIDIEFDWDSSTATLVNEGDDVLAQGQWVVISTTLRSDASQDVASRPVLHHARIESKVNAVLWLNVLSRHMIPDPKPGSNPWLALGTGEDLRQYSAKDNVSGHLVLCNDALDQLETKHEMAFSIMIILLSLPSVPEMRSYLTGGASRQLITWNQMSRAAVDLLRWIIASNRSYIVQVDDDPKDNKLAQRQEKISGVDGWIQFRFVQGSPEKEALFNETLKYINKPQKTLVAWHGSPLQNWHSILRHGLDYTVASHGRAYGNGIYFARDFLFSLSYSQRSDFNPTIITWPQSTLKIRAVVSLNELVNLPEKFQSVRPYFVVQHCHWTQCRYLFVQSEPEKYGDLDVRPAPNITDLLDSSSVPEFVQDSALAATGPQGTRLFIPQNAIPSARSGHGSLAGSSENKAEEPAMVSSDECEEDAKFIFHKDDETGFRPGTLDYSVLPLLAPPSYATEVAQKSLGKEIKRLEKIQSSTPLHELGWYINFERIDNLFQWIVELHSFDPSLPLAQDMKKAGLTSIIIEVRFLRGFPISPPFVRVIRPRFLPFMHGGGGHVTAGGAMCMELLTNTGWSPANSIESVFLQVRMAMCSLDPRPARLQKGIHQAKYSVGEAVEAYTRAANSHGWEVPKDLADVSAN
ncbi:hypothetical protein F4677DRAFT_445742 [Hypoxylon crocopeplum]|nr:hypothetical protein F4677DRAFT_445742 [Hypoxylon crocopeplum]